MVSVCANPVTTETSVSRPVISDSMVTTVSTSVTVGQEHLAIRFREHASVTVPMGGPAPHATNVNHHVL